MLMDEGEYWEEIELSPSSEQNGSRHSLPLKRSAPGVGAGGAIRGKSSAPKPTIRPSSAPSSVPKPTARPSSAPHLRSRSPPAPKKRLIFAPTSKSPAPIPPVPTTRVRLPPPPVQEAIMEDEEAEEFAEEDEAEVFAEEGEAEVSEEELIEKAEEAPWRVHTPLPPFHPPPLRHPPNVRKPFPAPLISAPPSADNRSVRRSFRDPPAKLSTTELSSIEKARMKLEVTVTGAAGAAYAPVSRFEELEVFPNYLTRTLADLEIVEPMPIQKQALPIILGGHDLIGIAKTGSGKTLAFLLPAIVHIEKQAPLRKGQASPIVLILAPTRELAVQICDEAKKLVVHSEQGNHPGGIRADCIYGGKSRREQVDSVSKGCHIIAATPGRLSDFIDTGVISVKRVTYFVLDEADRMLDFGFSDEVTSFGKKIRSDRHMLFFSATWPAEVQEFARNLCLDGRELVHLRVGQREDGKACVRDDITQDVAVFDQDSWYERDLAKKEHLYTHLRTELEDEDSKILVFVNSKQLADELATTLSNEGIMADSMHGGRGQEVRLSVLDKFRTGEIRLLVATDVMGRGLDIPDISHVVIYDMGDTDDYVHRIGRTARGPHGKLGHALVLFEYAEKWPDLAGNLAKVLEEANQEVPDELQRIADEVVNGERKIGFQESGRRKTMGLPLPPGPPNSQGRTAWKDKDWENWAKKKLKESPDSVFTIQSWIEWGLREEEKRKRGEA